MLLSSNNNSCDARLSSIDLKSAFRTFESYRVPLLSTPSQEKINRSISSGFNCEISDGLSLEAARDVAVQVVFALNRDVGIPKYLCDVGVRQEDILTLAQAVLT